MATDLSYSSVFHPQTDDKTERVNQMLEDILRASVIYFQGSWEDHISLIEFAYNNSYQATICIALYEASYGRPCRSPICWVEPDDSLMLGPELMGQKKNLDQRIDSIHSETAKELYR